MDEIPHLSEFERTHVGSHGAFTLRIHRRHAEVAAKAAHARRLNETEVSFGPAVKLRRAA